MKLGDVIVNLRKQKGVKQKELAESLGISAPHLSLIENGEQKTSVALISKIADYFDLPITVILFKALEHGETKDEKQKEYIKSAQPIVDGLIQYLLSGDEKPKRKKQLANIKHKLKKRTT